MLRKSKIKYGSHIIECEILSTGRKTMEIAVHPDSSVVVKIPAGTALVKINERIRKRAKWIIRQQNYFKQFQPLTPKRSYIAGETHLYLGRQYRLKTIEEGTPEVKLIRGFFKVSGVKKDNSAAIEGQLRQWYKEKARIHYEERLDKCFPAFARLGYTKPKIQIRQMKRRWGSLTKNGVMILNMDLIKAPKECIDYVITHELCHLKYHNHSAAFYKLLERVMPDWEKIKHKLEVNQS